MLITGTNFLMHENLFNNIPEYILYQNHKYKIVKYELIFINYHPFSKIIKLKSETSFTTDQEKINFLIKRSFKCSKITFIKEHFRYFEINEGFCIKPFILVDTIF